MTDIQILDDDLINKIAAGEVVERPASVVKELVENAIDAEATEVRIELKEGGTELIAVTDNGKGIANDEAPLAVKRHATSKICSADDLFAIDTLGFRGEALASIAAVSKFTLLTRRKGIDAGCKVELAEDGQLDVTPWQGPEGTAVIIKDLFYNIPARRAFLKKPAIEFGHILDLVQAMSLNIPDVAFYLVHNGREVFKAAPQPVGQHDFYRGEQALRERFKAIIGNQTADKLIYVTEHHTHGTIEALISPPGVDKGSGKGVFTFVNGRFVRDKTIRYGIMRGYHSHLLKGRHPICLMHISIDPTLVDVNVHPQKAELRFQYAGEVQSLIAQTIRQGIRSGAWADDKNWLTPPTLAPAPASPLAAGSRESTLTPYTTSSASLSATTTLPVATNTASNWRLESQRSAPPAAPASRPRETKISFDAPNPKGTPPSSPDSIFATPAAAPQGATSTGVPPIATTSNIDWASLNFVGSFSNCYLMFDTGEHLLVVDQHAFHERILYERFLTDYQNLGAPETLLMPEAVCLKAATVARIAAAMDTITKLGLGLTIIDAETIEIQSMPSLLKNCDYEQLLQQLASGLEHEDLNLNESEFSHKILSTMACHSAVRAGEHLAGDAVNDLLAEARGIDFYLNCPHGRRVFRKFSKKQVEDWFDR